MRFLCQNAKKEVTDFVSEIKRVELWTNLILKNWLAIQHGIQGQKFVVKNIEG